MQEKCVEPCADITRLEQQIRDLTEQNGSDHKEIRERLGKVELTNAVQNERYDTILGKLDDLTHRHDRLTGKLEALEAKPGKRWDSVVEKILLTVVAVVVTFLLARAGLA